jgi:hypothetical protein
MNPERKSRPSSRDHSRKAVVHVSELMEQIERMAGIRKKIQDHFYDQPEILADIADRLGKRLRE